jgi:hypothetical protein
MKSVILSESCQSLFTPNCRKAAKEFLKSSLSFAILEMVDQGLKSDTSSTKYRLSIQDAGIAVNCG